MEELKKEIVKQAKRILKKKKPNKTIWPEIESSLIEKFNEASILAGENPGSDESVEIFTYCRKKVVKSFVALEARYIVPSLPGQAINKLRLLKDSDKYTEYAESESDCSISDNEIDEQLAEKDKVIQNLKLEITNLQQRFEETTKSQQQQGYQSKAALNSEVVEKQEEIDNLKSQLDNLNAKLKNLQAQTKEKPRMTDKIQVVLDIVKPFDGNRVKLQQFIQQLKTAKAIMTTEINEICIEIIKSRVEKDSIRELIKDETTVDGIITKVQTSIPLLDSNFYVNKIRLVEVNESYISNLVKFSDMLASSYLQNGIPLNTAKTLVTATLKESVIGHHQLPADTKTAISLIQFSTPEDIIKVLQERLVTAKTSATVNAVFRGRGNYRRSYRGGYRGGRGRGRGRDGRGRGNRYNNNRYKNKRNYDRKESKEPKN